MTWFNLLCQALGRNDFLSADSVVPWAVKGDRQFDWQDPSITQIDGRSWELWAISPQGLEGSWRVREHADTRAVECSGSVRNVCNTPVTGIRALRTFDVGIGLAEAWGEPFIRTVNGGGLLPAAFPPDEFRHNDRQLARLPDLDRFVMAALEDGRSSGQDLPCAIIAGEAGDRGIALFYEWSGLWDIGLGLTERSDPEAISPSTMKIDAGVWGLDLEIRSGEELPLPNLLIVGFEGDLESGGNALRRHIARHVAPTIGGAPALPPVTFSTWFDFGNDFGASQLERAAEACSRAGVEYFAVDSGWFPGGFRCGIGNWSSWDPARFPEGVPAFGSRLAGLGLKLGLLFEPELAHVESELYRSHPEWFMPGPRRSVWSKPGNPLYWEENTFPPECFDVGERFALIDFGLAEARQWWIDRIIEVYEKWQVRWIRWDMNQQPRPHWDSNDEAGRIGMNQIRHVQGFYEVMDEIMRACPDLFVEQCASGGNRIDLGTVRRGHSFWMSDHTVDSDIIRAMQQGLNTVLPGIYATATLCQKRFDYDDYDYLSHGAGTFGFCGRIWKAPRQDFERYRAAVERFKGYRHLLGGDYCRSTGDPDRRFDRAEVAWTVGGETVEMSFNADGVRRSAAFSHAGKTA